jgi:hypothetical protein
MKHLLAFVCIVLLGFAVVFSSAQQASQCQPVSMVAANSGPAAVVPLTKVTALQGELQYSTISTGGTMRYIDLSLCSPLSTSAYGFVDCYRFDPKKTSNVQFAQLINNNQYSCNGVFFLQSVSAISMASPNAPGVDFFYQGPTSSGYNMTIKVRCQCDPLINNLAPNGNDVSFAQSIFDWSMSATVLVASPACCAVPTNQVHKN